LSGEFIAQNEHANNLSCAEKEWIKELSQNSIQYHQHSDHMPRFHYFFEMKEKKLHRHLLVDILVIIK
jgi:hypothetical protein